MIVNKGVHVECRGANPVIKRYWRSINVFESPHAAFFRFVSHFNRCDLKCWAAGNARDQSIQHSITVLDAERLNIGYHRQQYLIVT